MTVAAATRMSEQAVSVRPATAGVETAIPGAPRTGRLVSEAGLRTRADRIMEHAIAAGVAVLVLIGFVTSYDTLRLLAATDGGFPSWLAPAVPLSFDLGIVVLSLKVLAAARAGRTAVVLRALVAGLSAASVAANGAAATASSGMAGRLLHAVPPAMFVICFESVIATARQHALAGRPRRSRTLVWLLAPKATWRAWRGAVLAAANSQEVASDPQALGTHRSRTDDRSVTTATRRPSGSAAVHPRRSASDGHHVSPSSREDRLAVSRQLLEADPHLTASGLAARLAGQGHHVSVRTAQRIKAQVVI
jgi:hypothetical protein